MKFIYREAQDGYFAELTYELQKNKQNLDLNVIVVENLIDKDIEKDIEKDLEKVHLSKNLKRIVDEMLQNKFITQSELANKIAINEKNVRNNINKLKSKGLIQRIGPDKGGYWQVNSKSES
jgi:predicted HTH transcriptional regulator